MIQHKKPRPLNFRRQKIEEGAELTFAGVSLKIWGSWTWIKFKEKPSYEVLEQVKKLKGKQWRYNGKYTAWYCMEALDLQELVDELKTPLGAEHVTQLPTPEREEALFAEPRMVPAPAAVSKPVLQRFPESQWIAAQLDTLGEKMEATIAYKLNPPIGNQRMTRRRADIAQSMAGDGRRLQKIQAVLFRLADGHRGLALGDETALHPPLRGIRNRAQVEQLLFGWGESLTDRETIGRMEKAGISPADYKEARALVKGLLPGESPQTEKQVRLRQLERELIGAQIPGYFPTPPELVSLMLDHADIERGMQVLEPSAGKGNIAEQIRQRHPDAHLSCIEYQRQLREILLLKGLHLEEKHDFLEYQRAGWARIVMNPPFGEHGTLEDIDHVRHAYDLLMPGGRIVAIMGNSPFYRGSHEARTKTDQKAVEFRAWLDTLGATVEDIPAGMFDTTERPTGVPTKLVIIDKPGVRHDNPFAD